MCMIRTSKSLSFTKYDRLKLIPHWTAEANLSVYGCLEHCICLKKSHHPDPEGKRYLGLVPRKREWLSYLHRY